MKWLILSAALLASPCAAGTYTPVREPALSGNKHADLRQCKHKVTKEYYAHRSGAVEVASAMGGAVGGLLATSADGGVWSLDQKTVACMEALGYEHR